VVVVGDSLLLLLLLGRLDGIEVQRVGRPRVKPGLATAAATSLSGGRANTGHPPGTGGEGQGAPAPFAPHSGPRTPPRPALLQPSTHEGRRPRWAASLARPRVPAAARCRATASSGDLCPRQTRGWWRPPPGAGGTHVAWSGPDVLLGAGARTRPARWWLGRTRATAGGDWSWPGCPPPALGDPPRPCRGSPAVLATAAGPPVCSAPRGRSSAALADGARRRWPPPPAPGSPVLGPR
jgi:hypothetical protein